MITDAKLVELNNDLEELLQEARSMLKCLDKQEETSSNIYAFAHEKGVIEGIELVKDRINRASMLQNCSTS